MGRAEKQRIGEKYGDYTVIAKGDEKLTWVLQCKCGNKRLAATSTLSKRTNCGCVSRKKNKKQTQPFTTNTLAPARHRLLPGIYDLNYRHCRFPVKGRLINEYKNTASFEIIKCRKVDKSLLKALNNRIIMRKKDVLACKK